MIESGLKYAKPDSIEFKAYYMQKRRKKRKEASQTAEPALLLETGFNFLLENGDKLILEDDH